jgi:hypothetical protein
VSVRSAMVSRFCVWPTSMRWFLKMVQVIMKIVTSRTLDLFELEPFFEG